MELKMRIGFDQLVSIIKQLPVSELNRLKAELNNQSDASASNSDIKSFLLNGPVFGKEQLEEIKEARKQINKWRTK
ncbi:hypothetical protein BDE36_2543 [Arcticibacter tournemirensis]|uniref:Uncharacterized protein n=1 Tax=Arcticibacter tournemirensis TaxID=699437 RepID=A0A5M9GM81_9SPHI|nr:hypothetical protein [Arcticibacter tournemirensis]KAA8475676.1 hypothetical protein F1649_21280 [Arcticibacter tournemirensis]TQM50781.1 hypothetical protein BDE36_2543 [Arcticibacter tournemirensis]